MDAIDAMCRRGCGAGLGYAYSKAEQRFWPLYTFVAQEQEREARSQGEQISAVGPDAATIKRKLRDKFQNRKFAWNVTLEPDGTISKTRLLLSSGDAVIDKRGLDLLEAAAPYDAKFIRPKVTEPVSYIVQFPTLQVTGADKDTKSF